MKVEGKALDEICRFKLTDVFEDAESRQEHDQQKVKTGEEYIEFGKYLHLMLRQVRNHIVEMHQESRAVL